MYFAWRSRRLNHSMSSWTERAPPGKETSSAARTTSRRRGGRRRQALFSPWSGQWWAATAVSTRAREGSPSRRSSSCILPTIVWPGRKTASASTRPRSRIVSSAYQSWTWGREVAPQVRSWKSAPSGPAQARATSAGSSSTQNQSSPRASATSRETAASALPGTP